MTFNSDQNLAPQPPVGQILIYEDGGLNLQVRLDGQTVWLTQRLMADLYQVSVPTINEHLANIYNEGELNAEATIRKFRIVQTEGARQVQRNLDHYSLEAILAVGMRVRSARGTVFRQWAIARLGELLVKGFTMDDERLKAGRTLGDDYFEELLARNFIETVDKVKQVEAESKLKSTRKKKAEESISPVWRAYQESKRERKEVYDRLAQS